jgi:4-amino-4-deoxy-L-arabinose transferase-like glycosyltransferase
MTARSLANVCTSRRGVILLVAAELAVFLVLAITSVQHKSATSDEVVHVLAGVSYWRENDYRVDPENGNLPQRWMSLPLLVAGTRLPSLGDHPDLNEWALAQEFFYELGNDPDRMLLASRVMIALLAVALGALVYGWSSRLFGRGGGLVSLTLYCFSTAILANGPLATSDLTVTLFFLASVACLWHMLHHFTPLTVLASAVLMGLLFVSKMSAIMIVPMAFALVVIRLIRRQPLVVSFTPSRRWEVGRLGQLGLLAAAAVAHALIVVLIIWASFGFRYSAVRPDLPGQAQMDTAWSGLLDQPFPLHSPIVFAKDHHLLPEAFLYGQANVLEHSSKGHWAYAAGQYSVRGWWWFFPYCFVIKTQFALLAILLLAAIATVLACRSRRPGEGVAVVHHLWEGLYRTAPLWVLLAVYWASAVASSINIGHRHILPTYPAMFILAGGAVRFFGPQRRAAWRWVVGLLLAAYVAEALWIWPHYLAYFNQLVGGPRGGYRCLVDSSLDWGQDVPGLARWLDERGLNGLASPTPVYFSYFGNGSPTYYRIRAQRLPGYDDADLWKNPAMPVPLRGGYYCVSASMLPMIMMEPRGPWSVYWEQTYQESHAWFHQFMSQPIDVRREQVRINGPEISADIDDFGLLRLGRLMAFLRHREPDDQVGHSILIYRLSDAEVARAVDPNQPPAEQTPDQVDLWDKLHAE